MSPQIFSQALLPPVLCGTRQPAWKTQKSRTDSSPRRKPEDGWSRSEQRLGTGVITVTPGLAGVEGRVAFRLETARMETGEGQRLEEEDSPSFT